MAYLYCPNCNEPVFSGGPKCYVCRGVRRFVFLFWIPMMFIIGMVIAIAAKWLNIPLDRLQVP